MDTARDSKSCGMGRMPGFEWMMSLVRSCRKVQRIHGRTIWALQALCALLLTASSMCIAVNITRWEAVKARLWVIDRWSKRCITWQCEISGADQNTPMFLSQLWLLFGLAAWQGPSPVLSWDHCKQSHTHAQAT